MPPFPSRFTLAACTLLACGPLAACGGPIDWRGDATELATPGVSSVAGAGADSNASTGPGDGEGVFTSADGSLRLALREDGQVALDRSAIPATLPTAADSLACHASLRIDAASPSEIYGVWWSRREGGRAALVAARSDNAGATWTSPVPVDTTDRSVAACNRPAPAISADAASRYVHVTYFLQSRDGPGVFFAHSMERGELFHAPVPILYGERPALSAVTSADSVVVVAFENPNSRHGQISLAMSRTWGHIFTRERPDASDAGTPAASPLVTMRGDTIAVGWRDGAGRVVARVGTLR